MTSTTAEASLRLIPARAGKTMSWSIMLRGSSAHPRACGENSQGQTGEYAVTGSSPRVRGKHLAVLEVGGPVGLIPARAGKTCGLPRRAHRTRAHPRACGENPSHGRALGYDQGSSPRVRGKPNPAHIAYDFLVAHPRACGENGGGLFSACGRGGSSPRVRGKRRRRRLQQMRLGLIPARAGKTR